MCLKVNYIIYQTVCTKIQYTNYEDLKPDCEGNDKKNVKSNVSKVKP